MVHGIGAHKKGWSKSIKDSLNKLAKQYDAFDANGLKDLVEFEEIED